MDQETVEQPAEPASVDLLTWAQAFDAARHLAINNAKIFNKYTPFSNEVYGEANPAFVAAIIAKLQLTPDDVFVDIGSGIGNVVLQVAAQAKCKAYGIEVRPELHKIANKMLTIFTQVDVLEGIDKLTTFHLGDITDTKYEELLPKCTVVYMHNTCFPATLQEDILKIFQRVLVPGTRVVTLQDLAPRYRPSSLRASTDPMRIFRYPAATHRSMQDAVDWRSKPIHYYIYSVKRSDEEDDLTYSPPSSLSSSPSDSDGEAPIFLDDNQPPFHSPFYPHTPNHLAPSDVSPSSPSFNKFIQDAGVCVKGLAIQLNNTSTTPEKGTIGNILSTLTDILSSLAPPTPPLLTYPSYSSLSASSSSSSSKARHRSPASKSPKSNSVNKRASQTAKARAARLAKLAKAQSAKPATVATTKIRKSKDSSKTTKLQQKAKLAHQSLKRTAPDTRETESSRKKKKDEAGTSPGSRPRPKKEKKKPKKRVPIPEKFFELKDVDTEEYLDGSTISNLAQENILAEGSSRRDRKPTRFINISTALEKYEELTAEALPNLAPVRRRPNLETSDTTTTTTTTTTSLNKSFDEISEKSPTPKSGHKRNIPVPEFGIKKEENKHKAKQQKTTPIIDVDAESQPQSNEKNNKKNTSKSNSSSKKKTTKPTTDAKQTPTSETKNKSKGEITDENKSAEKSNNVNKKSSSKKQKIKEEKKHTNNESDTETNTDSSLDSSPSTPAPNNNNKSKKKKKRISLPTSSSPLTFYFSSPPPAPPTPLVCSSSSPSPSFSSTKSKKHKKSNTLTPTPITTPTHSTSSTPSSSSRKTSPSSSHKLSPSPSSSSSSSSSSRKSSPSSSIPPKSGSSKKLSKLK